MYHNFNALQKKLTKALVLTCFALLIYSSAQAQRGYYSGYGGSESNWGISIIGGYDVPTGDMGTTFKAAPTFGVSVKHNYGDFTFNANIGYVSYKPKLDTFYYDPTDKTAGYIKYDNFSSLQFYVGAAYNIAISDQAKFYFGIDLGSYYNYFSYVSNAGLGYDAASSSNEESYFAPKLGINFMLNDNLSLGIEGKYNFLFSSSSGSGDAYDYGYTTTTNKSYSGNLVLTYNF